MEAAICTLVTQFKMHAGSEGSSSTLSKDEFHKLVATQLPNYVKVAGQSCRVAAAQGDLVTNEQVHLYVINPQNASDPGAIDQLMGSLDENNDGELTFSEFWQLIGKLASKQGGFTQ